MKQHDFRLSEPHRPDERINRILAMNESILRMNEQMLKAITLPGLFIQNIKVDMDDPAPVPSEEKPKGFSSHAPS